MLKIIEEDFIIFEQVQVDKLLAGQLLYENVMHEFESTKD